MFDRDDLTRALASSYIILEEFRPAVAEAIRRYANRHYSAERIHAMVARPQSPLQTFKYLTNQPPGVQAAKGFPQWLGRLDEWLICLEYNSLKNKGGVQVTIVNPDPSSKCDLLHVLKINGQYKCVAGPDCKGGQPAYVIAEWERLLRSTYDVPFVDVEGWLTDDHLQHKLTAKQRERLAALRREFPRKAPVATQVTSKVRLHAAYDLQARLMTGALPSARRRAGSNSPRPPQARRHYEKATLVDKANARYNKSTPQPWTSYRLTPAPYSHRVPTQMGRTTHSLTASSHPLHSYAKALKSLASRAAAQVGPALREQLPVILLATMRAGTRLAISAALQSGKQAATLRAGRNNAVPPVTPTATPFASTGTPITSSPPPAAPAPTPTRGSQHSGDRGLSPAPYLVRPYTQRYHTRNGVISKQIEGGVRGGKGI